jgi:hypothetical protein
MNFSSSLFYGDNDDGAFRMLYAIAHCAHENPTSSNKPFSRSKKSFWMNPNYNADKIICIAAQDEYDALMNKTPATNFCSTKNTLYHTKCNVSSVQLITD